MKSEDAKGLPTVEERDLTLVATLVTVIVVASGIFLVNAASTKYRTAGYTPPAINGVSVIPPSSSQSVPKQ